MFTSPYPSIDEDGTTLTHVLEQAVRRHPERTALVDGPSGRSVTFAELARRVDQVAGWLDERGVGRGDTVALWTPNTPPWAAVAWAAMRLGATVTGLNPAYTPAEAQALLAQAQPSVAFTQPHLVALARECGVATVLSTAPADGATSLEEVLAREAGDRVREIAADPSTVALLPFSSGTTGLPKGVELTHANLVAALRQAAVPPCRTLTGTWVHCAASGAASCARMPSADVNTSSLAGGTCSRLAARLARIASQAPGIWASR